MPQFIVTCIDRKNCGVVRADARDDHIQFLDKFGEQILLVGPVLDEENGIVGSHYIIEADNCESARCFVESDPFAKAGLFETIVVNRFKIHAGILLQG